MVYFFFKEREGFIFCGSPLFIVSDKAQAITCALNLS